MTHDELRAACDRAGGIAALARLIGKPKLYVQRRLTTVGTHRTEPQPISRMDELAVLKALNLCSVSELTEGGR